jgi:hypothetical protein
MNKGRWMMDKRRKNAAMKCKLWIIGLSMALLLAWMGVVVGLADNGGVLSEPAVSWWLMSGGGGLSGSDNVAVESSLGQPVAGVAVSSGNQSLGAGYWFGEDWFGEELVYVYLPLLIR